MPARWRTWGARVSDNADDYELLLAVRTMAIGLNDAMEAAAKAGMVNRVFVRDRTVQGVPTYEAVRVELMRYVEATKAPS